MPLRKLYCRPHPQYLRIGSPLGKERLHRIDKLSDGKVQYDWCLPKRK